MLLTSCPFCAFQAVALRALYTLHKEETRHFADSLILKATLQWLLAHQGEDGSFMEAYLYEGFRNGQLPRAAQKTPLTAQVLVLLSDIANEVIHQIGENFISKWH